VPNIRNREGVGSYARHDWQGQNTGFFKSKPHRVRIVEVGPGNEATRVNELALVLRVELQWITVVCLELPLCLCQLHVAAAPHVPRAQLRM